MQTLISQFAEKLEAKTQMSARTTTATKEATDKAILNTRTRTDSRESQDVNQIRMARTITEAREAPDKKITTI